MTLQDLCDQILPIFPSYAQKDLKTAVKVLSQALGAPDAAHCPPELYQRPYTALERLVDIYLSQEGKSVHTLRNTKNNLRRMFRLATDRALLTPVPDTITRQFANREHNHRPGSEIKNRNGSHLARGIWPQALRDEFEAFTHWATAPFVKGRPAQWRKRPETMRQYYQSFARYFGYLHHIRHVALEDLCFDQLLDFTLLRDYVHWHINELHQRPTRAILQFLQNTITYTRQYHPTPKLTEQLVQLKQEIPLPPPLYDKTDAWVPLDTLRDIGEDLWPRKLPHQILVNPARVHGARTAALAALSLILRLWTYRPYRARNIHEMQLDTNLYKTVQGQWRIKYVGEQLKVAVKGGRTNVFDLPFPPQLTPHLDMYLSTWRPILAARTDHRYPHVFLRQNGTPYNTVSLWRITTAHVFAYTGKHWHPHIVRTVWATEYLLKTGNFLKAAIMLNDTIDTVIKNYAHLLDTNVAEEVDNWRDNGNT